MIDNLATKLVAEHDIARQIHWLAAGDEFRHLHHAVRMLARVQIGTADAAGERPHQDLPGVRLRLGQVVDDDLAVPKNRSPHLVVPLLLLVEGSHSTRDICLQQCARPRSCRWSGR